MSSVLLGSHVGMSGPGYFLDTCKTAISWEENCFMFYTGAPQNSFRTPLENCKIKEGLQFLDDNHFDKKNIIVHAPYIINLANTDQDKFDISIKVLTNELKRTFCFGSSIIVLHPGSAVGGNDQEGLDNITRGLDLAIENANNDVCIALETMAGKGHELGRNFNELSYIIKHSKYPNKLGVCLDTCHINDAGYLLNDFNKILDEFDKIIGLSYLKVIHLNDSKNELNSHKDRHENIGFGTIGFDNLINVVFNERVVNVPKILETPYINEQAPYKKEIEMIKSKKFDPNLKNYF